MDKKEYKTTPKTMRCGHCNNKTIMKIISQGAYELDASIYVQDELMSQVSKHYRILNVLCPNCEQLNIIESTKKVGYPYGEEYDHEEKYLYPISKDFSDQSSKAKDIRNTFREASMCFRSELYTSSVMMCRKTMEMLCVYFDINLPDNLHDKLRIMRNEGFIDDKLYEWADTLKKLGNEAVHDATHFSQQDAQDILDFTYALVEYCIDFTHKFKTLLQRRGLDESATYILEKEKIDTLMEALNDEDIAVRYYAATILAQNEIELEKIVPVLLTCTENKPFSKNATDHLKRLGNKINFELINILENHKDDNLRAAAVTILGALEVNNDALEGLIKALKDKNEKVKNKTVVTLEKFGYTAVDTFIRTYTS